MPGRSPRARALLHPIRVRIVTALQDRQLTPRQLSVFLDDVPLTTLYRHINLLLEAGLLEVVAERRVHGTVERVFTVVEAATYLNDEDRASLTAEDITGLVGALTGAVQEVFHRYVRHAPLPPPEGDVSFLVRSLTLSEERYLALRQYLLELMRAESCEAPQAGEPRRMIAFFSAPDFEPEKKNSDES
ncbi:helix-turn-helix domain-containing protein [Armatimonas rosea]|uniref:DNA-binding transcriptional ArsR family regulator n=1 Tax=Armatimonas rosea TaxID=685828 RepID=A0A7W9SMH9_ARMRO|nr:helix-turn-helix domain-containing protein [Armatimonas rosea]MBB6049376.1 DNA-binding transcriptional ArsR family regulator [Armatimonas rosea]